MKFDVWAWDNRINLAAQWQVDAKDGVAAIMAASERLGWAKPRKVRSYRNPENGKDVFRADYDAYNMQGIAVSKA